MWGNLCILYSPPNISSRLVHASFVMRNFRSPTRIWSFMRKYHPFLVGRNISSLLRHCVLIAGNNVVSHFETKGNSIRESVMLRGKKLFRSIHQISHTLFIIRSIGGVMRGIRWVMGKSLISHDEHSSKWENWWGRCPYMRSEMLIRRILNLQIISDEQRIVISVL